VTELDNTINGARSLLKPSRSAIIPIVLVPGGEKDTEARRWARCNIDRRGFNVDYWRRYVNSLSVAGFNINHFPVAIIIIAISPPIMPAAMPVAVMAVPPFSVRVTAVMAISFPTVRIIVAEGGGNVNTA
jgi:hypothetical protein